MSGGGNKVLATGWLNWVAPSLSETTIILPNNLRSYMSIEATCSVEHVGII